MTSIFGRIKSAGLDRFGYKLDVQDVTTPAEGFVLVTLGGPELGDQSWRPGHSVQIRTPDDQLRSYTPFSWDQQSSRMRLLGTGAGLGPGTEMLGRLASGDRVQILGPKKSTNLELTEAPILVGDETSIALCVAWTESHPDLPATVLLESNRVRECSLTNEALGLEAQVTASCAALTAAVVAEAEAQPDAPMVVTGRAQSIKTIRRALKEAGLQQRTTRAQAHWDENRSGLD